MRITIITGGGSGIGAAVARRLAGPGHALMLHGQGADDDGRARLDAVAAQCRQAGARVEWTAGDLAAAGAGTQLVQHTQSMLGPVDALVHCAGFADRRSFRDLPRDDLQRSLAVMPLALHELAAAALTDLQKSAGGRVVAVSSFVAHRFVAGGTFPASAAAKAAVEALVRCLAIELAPSGATANAVVPGFTQKDPGRSGALNAASWDVAARANPLGRLADPKDIAATIGFLLSAEAGHITGALLPIDGGLTLA